ncbi:hypothetical protein OS189_16940 [Sulfitobacter sp. F26169L]|uniref:hypothetical protein n=1 Tax=Sulfitobacter sp. F26169L TaxID=2996015 RepID=UPI0022608AD1|nr:hypothetical protein [Sulfitobacter sp. F26169L]MCX7568031.1 hypothetical protein [Sulfitobacter sp. F26169L]
MPPADKSTDLLKQPPAMTAADSAAEIQRVLRAEIATLRAENDALRAQVDQGQTGDGGAALARLQHRHGVELTLAHMRQIVWYAGHPDGVHPVSDMITLLEKSTLFDAQWYLSRDAGLRASDMSPAEHYLRAGAYEGRDPGPGFDTMGYYLANPDVAAAGWPALAHYEAYGRDENRALQWSPA